MKAYLDDTVAFYSEMLSRCHPRTIALQLKLNCTLAVSHHGNTRPCGTARPDATATGSPTRES